MAACARRQNQQPVGDQFHFAVGWPHMTVPVFLRTTRSSTATTYSERRSSARALNLRLRFFVKDNLEHSGAVRADHKYERDRDRGGGLPIPSRQAASQRAPGAALRTDAFVSFPAANDPVSFRFFFIMSAVRVPLIRIHRSCCRTNMPSRLLFTGHWLSRCQVPKGIAALFEVRGRQ